MLREELYYQMDYLMLRHYDDPEYILDFATLTGAVVIALGTLQLVLWERMKI